MIGAGNMVLGRVGKMLLVALLCLIGHEAKAQFTPIYTSATGTQILNFNLSGTSFTATAAIVFPAVRLVCTVSCFVGLNASGSVVAATLTGIFLTPLVPQDWIANRGGKITVRSENQRSNVGGTTGALIIMELAR